MQVKVKISEFSPLYIDCIFRVRNPYIYGEYVTFLFESNKQSGHQKKSDNALCILSFHQLLLTICAYCFSQNFLDLLQNIILCHFISDFHIVCVPFIFSWWLINIKDTSQSLDSFLSLLSMSSLKLDFKKMYNLSIIV